jgi:hypothetical protein
MMDERRLWKSLSCGIGCGALGKALNCGVGLLGLSLARLLKLVRCEVLGLLGHFEY